MKYKLTENAHRLTRKLMIISTICLVFGCKQVTNQQSCVVHERAQEQVQEDANGIYYWKTEFELSQWDKAFLHNNNIRRLYIRLFDVDLDKEHRMPIPIATTRFRDSIPNGIEIVPVVYITTAVLKDYMLSGYTDKFYKRIQAMAKKNGFESFKEIQLDCDWTNSTEAPYFIFCKEIVQMAAQDSIEVSATIRLHQLQKKVPQVKRGVLMLYNTGSIYNPKTENSILTASDVEPYLKSAISYQIPLSFSYPTYGWGILFRDGEFASILHRTDYSDKEHYQPQGGNRYKVIKEHYLENKMLKVGDVIRLEQSDIREINRVQNMVTKQLGKPLSTIIYHLDSLNLSSYSHDEIKSIYQ